MTTVGSMMVVTPDPLPHLDVVEACGKAIDLGQSSPVSVLLPFGSPSGQIVKIQARDFGANIPIALALTPDNGPRTIVEAEIDNRTSNPATLSIPVTLPPNVQVTIHAWTR